LEGAGEVEKHLVEKKVQYDKLKATMQEDLKRKSEEKDVDNQ